MDLSDERLDELAAQMVALHERLRQQTHGKHGRINPFAEDLFSWKERGSFWTDEDRNVTIYNSTTVVGDVEIGRDTWIGPFCSLDGTGGLTIGRNCSISLGSQLLSHDTFRWALTGGKASAERAPTSIGDCCFIGTLATVLRGVSIGQRCLVAAGAVVTRDVPDNTIVGGMPATPIGQVELIGDDQVELHWNRPGGGR